MKLYIGLLKLGREILVLATSTFVVITVLSLTGILHTGLRFPFSAGPRSNAAVGAKAGISGVSFPGKTEVLVLVTNDQCHFCAASRDFHRTLITTARRAHIPVFVAVPSRALQMKYLTELGATPAETREWKDLSFSVGGTPTVVVISADGRVKALRRGQLGPDSEKEMLRELTGGPIMPANPDGKSASVAVNRQVKLAATEERDSARKNQLGK